MRRSRILFKSSATVGGGSGEVGIVSCAAACRARILLRSFATFLGRLGVVGLASLLLGMLGVN